MFRDNETRLQLLALANFLGGWQFPADRSRMDGRVSPYRFQAYGK